MEDIFQEDPKPTKIIKKTKEVKTTLDNNKLFSSENKKSEEPVYTIKSNPPIDYVSPETHEIKDNVTKEQYDKIGEYSPSENTEELIADTQSSFDVIKNTVGRVITNFLGGTVESIGSIGAIATSVANEIQGKDADFTNTVTDVGRAIKEWGQKEMPVYRPTHDSWDMKSLSWWMNGVESAASSLDFLVGGAGVAKGFGLLADWTKLTKGLTKLGLNGGRIAQISQRVTTAGFMRNAENLQNSYDDKRQVKSSLLDEWTKNPDTYKIAQQGDAAKELLQKGHELTPENLANYIGSKVGWRSYYINAANIVFDYIELTPMLKGNFNYKTRLGRFETPTKVLEAQNSVIGREVNSITKLNKAFDYLNPIIGTIGRNLTEGIEEGVNYIGSKEAKNYGEQLQGKKTKSVTERLGKYLKSEDFYENMFWGTLGGTISQGFMPSVSKAYKLIKGDKSNSDIDYRISEIQGRQDLINQASQKIGEITNNKDISDTDKKDHINQIKSELAALDLGTRAAQAHNTHLLIQQMSTPEFKDNLVKNGIAEEGDVEKAVAKSIEDVLTSEKLYKKYYNIFQSYNINDFARNYLINQSITHDFLIHKNTEKFSKINKEAEDLKTHDAYINSTNDINVEQTIQLKALEGAKAAFFHLLKNNKEQLSNSKGLQEIQNIDAEIKKIKEFIGDKEASLSGLNPNIISKQIQVILGKRVNNIHAKTISELQNPETGKKIEEQINTSIKDNHEKDLQSFKNNIDNEIKDNKHTSTSLNDLQKQYKDNPAKVAYLKDKIKILKSKETKKATEDKLNELRNKKTTETSENNVFPVNEKEQDKLNELRNKKTTETSENNVFPVNEKEQDDFEGIPEHTIEDVNETDVNPAYKPYIDKYHSEKDVNQLRQFIGDTIDEKTKLYSKNKIQELKNERNKNTQVIAVNEFIKENSSVNEFDDLFPVNKNTQVIAVNEFIKESNFENEFDEDAQNNLPKKGNIEDLTTENINPVKEEEGIVFNIKVDGVQSIRCATLFFGLTNFPNVAYLDNQNIVLKNIEYEDAFKILIDPTFTEGSEIEIKIDKDNITYEGTKIDPNNVPLGIFYNGKHTQVYISTIKGVKNLIEQAKKIGDKETQNARELDLIEIQKIRNKINLSDKGFKTILTKKGNGSIIQHNFDPNALKSCKGIFKDFCYTKSGDNATLVNTKNPEQTYGYGKEYQSGVLYGLLEGWNSKPIPVPLRVSQLSLNDANNVQKNIQKLINLLDNARKNYEEIHDVEIKLREFIKVDTRNQIERGSPVGFRSFTKDVEEKRDASIEFSFYSKGEKLHAIVKNGSNGAYFMIAKDGKTISDPKSPEKVYERPINTPKFLEILQKKYYNVDFQKMESKYYIYNLIKNGIIKTDIAQVTNKRGEVISNLFGSNNDFDFYIATDLDIKEEKEQTEENVKTEEKETLTNTDDIFSLMNIEIPFLTPKNYKEEEYKDKYNLNKLVSTTTANTLEEISSNAQGVDIKFLADWLQPLLSKNPSIVKKAILGIGIRGNYSTIPNIIKIDLSKIKDEETFQRVFLHETLHSLTGNQLLKYVQVKESKGFKKGDEISAFTDFDNLIYRENTPQYVKDFVNSIFEDYSKIKNNIERSEIEYKKDDLYGLNNILEFIAELPANDKFRQIVQDNTDIGFFGRLYNSIVEFLNKVLKLNLDTVQKKKITKSINSIRQFIEKSDNIELQKNISINTFNNKFDEFKGDISIPDVHKLVTYFQSVLLSKERQDKKNYSTQEIIEFKNKFKKGFEGLKPLVTAEQSSNINNVLKHYDKLFELALIQRNRKYKSNFDINEIVTQDTEELLEKKWDNNAANKIASQDTVTKEIKKFIETIPYITGFDVTFEGDNIKDYKVSKDDNFGITQYLDFNSVYPYLIRNLIGSKTGAEIISKLKALSKIQIPNSDLPFGSFAYIAKELESNHKLLTQFITNISSKYTYDSYVIFFKNLDNRLEARVDNENKSGNRTIQIANKWVKSTNDLINHFKEFPDGFLSYKENIKQLRNKINQLALNFNNNKLELANKLFTYSNSLLNNTDTSLSMPAIIAALDEAKSWNDFTTYPTLNYISDAIIEQRSSDNFKNLNKLAELEQNYSIDSVENTIIDINGNPLYAIRNPSFLSNFFSFLHNKSKEGKTEVEEYLKNISTIPELQYSNWLWKFINFEITKEGIKVFKSVNYSNLEKFNFHPFGGAKEEISKDVQQYHEFTDEDWKLINFTNFYQDKTINYKNTNKNKVNTGFTLYPSLTPSDSSTMNIIEAPKIDIKNNDLIDKVGVSGKIIGKTINTNSSIFKALVNINLQEVRRIQQEFQRIFELDNDGKLIVKKGLDNKLLIANEHYNTEEAVFNEDGTIDIEKSLLKNDKPTGRTFYFQNQLVGNKRLDSYEIKLDHHLFVNEVSPDVLKNIEEFTKKATNQLISEGIKEYKSFEEQLDKTLRLQHKDFQTTISEYVLNLHINFVEQTNFLQGSLTFYKDVIDATKRHKQVSAPGNAYSPEAMKMKRKNGSWCNGEVFELTIFKDIKRSSNQLEELKKYITSLGYDKINTGDAQGYITLDRAEQLLRGQGKFDDYYDKLFKSIRSGNQVERNDLKRLHENFKTLQPFKNFYFGLHYDTVLLRLVPKELKYSTIILIPHLVKDTHLELLMNTLEEKGIDEAIFESGSKVGSQQVHKIDIEGTLSPELLSKITSTPYYNKNLLLQLEVPEHIVDETNRLATQISKIIISNIPDNVEYQIGNELLKGKELKEYYFKVLNSNINQSAQDLLRDLDITQDENGKYNINYNKLSEILKQEVQDRRLSENFNFSLDIDKGNFKMPLFMNNMDKKWQSILLALFTNRILKQKMPGLSTVLASNIGFNKHLEQSQYDMTGINWLKDKETDRTLKVFDNNGIKIVECIVGRWSSKFFKEGQAININDIPSDILESIGYRVPADTKHSIVMLKVVGFLPEESKGLIIMPDDMITQMGSDFDIDKLTLITQNLVEKNGKIEVLKYEDSTNYDEKQLQDLYNRISGKYILNKYEKEIQQAKNANDKEGINLAQAIIFADEEYNSDRIIDEIKADKQYQKIKEKNEKFISYNKWKNLSPLERVDTRQRQNILFNIFKGILINKQHYREIINPNNFDDYENIANGHNGFNELQGKSDDSLNVLSDNGQREIRSRNVSGIALKGIFSNMNAFIIIAQHSKMTLANGFKFAIKVQDNKQELKDKYKEDISFEKRDNGEYALIEFKNLGFAPDGSFTDINGKLITDNTAQGAQAAFDAAKTPTLKTINATTYTGSLLQSFISSGMSIELAALFIGQPIMVNLNNHYFQQKSLLGDNSGKEVEIIKKWYQTYLLYELRKQKGKDFKSTSEIIKLINRRIQNQTSLEDKENLVYLEREKIEEILGYNPNEKIYFSEKDLREQIKLQAKGLNNLTPEQRLKYFRTQLQIIEHFGEYRKNSQTIEDILRVSKTDGIGAGQTFETTTKLTKDIEGLRNAQEVLIDGEPAINKLYPKENESSYSPITSFYKNVNLLSYDILNSLFISENEGYKAIRESLQSLYNIQDNEKINKFLNTLILQNFDKFKSLSKNNVLGILFPVNESKELTLDEFKNLSTANKVYYLQQKQKDYLDNNPMHILNFLQTKLNKTEISDNGYHKIDIQFYKNEFTDDTLIQNLIELYNEGTEYEKELVKDLINYSAITNGLFFGLNSFSKIIPNEILHELSVGDYMYSQSNSNIAFQDSTIDLFFKNNWNNNKIVPTVRTLWLKKKDENGKLKNVIDREGNYITKGKTPIWIDNNGIITISKDSLKNVSFQVKQTPYILIHSKENGTENTISKLYKKVETKGNLIYYYQIDKLGKDGIIEDTERSMFNENNRTLNGLEEIVNQLVEGAKIDKTIEPNIPSMFRHGETKQDSISHNSGWNEIHLSLEGIEEAKKKGQIIKEAGIKTLIVSSTYRAQQTAKIISEIANTKIITNDLLKSWNLGDFEGKPEKEFDEAYYVNNPDIITPNGESFNTFKNRVIQATESINYDTQSLVLSHSKVMSLWRALVKAKGWNEESKKEYLKDKDYKDVIVKQLDNILVPKGKSDIFNTSEDKQDDIINKCNL